MSIARPPAATLGVGDGVGDQQRKPSHEEADQQHLGRQQHLHAEHDPHQQDEPSLRDLLVEALQHQQHGGRRQEDRREVEVAEQVGGHVGAEAEHQPTDERRAEAVGEVAAEPEGKPGRERRQQHRDDVVGDHRPGHERHRGHEERCRWEREPALSQVRPVGRPDDVGHERVEPVEDRVRPPLEGPHERGRIAVARAGADRVRVQQGAATEQSHRKG
jgi:hypothetical protein